MSNTSCETCEGSGLIKNNDVIVCDCSRNQITYIVCCYCQNGKKYGNYVECKKCWGTGKATNKN